MVFMNMMREPEGRPSAWGASRLFVVAPLTIFVATVGIQLFGPVPIGLANNNDFARVLGPLRLWPAPPNRDTPNVLFKYFVNDYVVSDPSYDTGVPSSERLVAGLAKWIARFFLPAGTFRLSFMGLIHGAILTFALFIFLRALRTRGWRLRVAGSALLIFVWTDLEYIQELNTAYTDAAAVVMLAVVFALAVQSVLATDGSRWHWAVVFGLCGSLLLGTKTQHESALPFLAAFCLWTGIRSSCLRDRAAWTAMPIFFVGVAGYMLERTPASYRVAPAFSLVFYKITSLSPDPMGVLTEFQMPAKEFGSYLGHYAYEPGVPLADEKFRQLVLSRVTPASLASFYRRHPGVVVNVLLCDMRDWAPYVSLDLNGQVYGHLREADIRSGKRPFELAAWSWFRRNLFRVAPFHLIYLFALVLVLSGVCLFNRKLRSLFPMWPVILFSALLAISSFLFASLSDGSETARHLVFFQAATDLTIVSLLLSILLIVEEHPFRSWRAVHRQSAAIRM